MAGTPAPARPPVLLGYLIVLLVPPLTIEA